MIFNKSTKSTPGKTIFQRWKGTWRLSSHVQCWHPTWAPATIPETHVMFQLCAATFGKAGKWLESLISSHPNGRYGWSYKLLAVAWPSSGHWAHLGSEITDGNPLLSSFPSFLPTLSHPGTQRLLFKQTNNLNLLLRFLHWVEKSE